MRDDLTEEQKHEFAKDLYQRALTLRDGQSLIHESEEKLGKPVPWDFDLHFYEKHGTFLFWHKPGERQNLGIKLVTPDMLWKACLNQFDGPEMKQHIIQEA